MFVFGLLILFFVNGDVIGVGIVVILFSSLFSYL